MSASAERSKSLVEIAIDFEKTPLLSCLRRLRLGDLSVVVVNLRLDAVGLECQQALVHAYTDAPESSSFGSGPRSAYKATARPWSSAGSASGNVSD